MNKNDFICKSNHIQFRASLSYKNFYVKENIAYLDGHMHNHYSLQIGYYSILSFIINSNKEYILNPLMAHRYSFEIDSLIFLVEHSFVKQQQEYAKSHGWDKT